MKSIEVSGKTVDEAIFNGLDQMGLSIDEVDIQIVEQGGKGLFGIVKKQAVIRLTERDKESAAKAVEQAAKQAEVEKQKRNNNRQEKPRRERAPRRQQQTQQEPKTHSRYAGKECEPGAEGEFLTGMLEKMGIENQIKCMFNQENNSKYIEISGKGMGVLIGRRGETLNAMQYLCSLVGNKNKDDYHRVVLDAENYRGRRESALVKLAENKANDVKRSGRSVRLEPMNPYDRRVLHATLQSNPNVTTYSEGEEPNRRVVIARS